MPPKTFFTTPPVGPFCLGPDGTPIMPVRIESDGMVIRAEYEYPTTKSGLKAMLRPGYVCVTRNGHYLMVLPSKYGMCLSGEDAGDLTCWDDDLTICGGPHKLDIVKVYGPALSPKFACTRSFADRELIWERKETKKMTVKEICDALGYDVEIIKDGGSDA